MSLRGPRGQHVQALLVEEERFKATIPEFTHELERGRCSQALALYRSAAVTFGRYLVELRHAEFPKHDPSDALAAELRRMEGQIADRCWGERSATPGSRLDLLEIDGVRRRRPRKRQR
jgi:hypothetical protein